MPTITSLSPATAQAGGIAFTLTVNGTGFVNGAVVYWGSIALTTAFVSAVQLTATVTAGLIALAGVVSITVLQSGVPSSPVLFPVPSPPAAFDLTTVNALKGYLYPVVGAVTDDYTLQLLVTDASQFIINETRRGADLYSSSAASERYDGNNQDFLRLRRNPVTACSLVQMNSVVIPQTPDFVQPGWAINSENTGIILVSGVNGQYPLSFPFPTFSFFARGRMNILVNYTAGFSQIQADLAKAALHLIAQNYKRRGWIDEKSRALPGGGGTQTYRDWDMPLEVRRTIRYYQRVTP